MSREQREKEEKQREHIMILARDQGLQAAKEDMRWHKGRVSDLELTAYGAGFEQGFYAGTLWLLDLQNKRE